MREVPLFDVFSSGELVLSDMTRREISSFLGATPSQIWHAAYRHYKIFGKYKVVLKVNWVEWDKKFKKQKVVRVDPRNGEEKTYEDVWEAADSNSVDLLALKYAIVTSKKISSFLFKLV